MSVRCLSLNPPRVCKMLLIGGGWVAGASKEGQTREMCSLVTYWSHTVLEINIGSWIMRESSVGRVKKKTSLLASKLR